MRYTVVLLVCLITAYPVTQMTQSAQTQSLAPKPPDTIYLLKPARVFDGESAQLHDGWVVLVRGDKIEAAGPAGEIKAPADAKVIELPGMTLMPGLIEARLIICETLCLPGSRRFGILVRKARVMRMSD